MTAAGTTPAHDSAREIDRLRNVRLAANTLVDVPFAEIDQAFLHPDGLLRPREESMDDNTKPHPPEANWPASSAPISTALAPYPTTAGRLREGNRSSDDGRSPRAAVKERSRLPVRVAYAALAWVVVFFAFHIYWYLGGSFASPGELPSLIPNHLVAWILLPLNVAWPLGAWVCLAIARGWPRGRMRRAASIVVWLGCTVLVVRGVPGLIDDLTRAVGLLPDGLTGLSTKQTTGMGHLTWSGWTIDAYFFAGGLLFGLLAYRYRPPRSEKRQRVTVDLQLTAKTANQQRATIDTPSQSR